MSDPRTPNGLNVAEQSIMALSDEGMTDRAIAAQLGFTLAYVRSVVSMFRERFEDRRDAASVIKGSRDLLAAILRLQASSSSAP